MRSTPPAIHFESTGEKRYKFDSLSQFLVEGAATQPRTQKITLLSSPSSSSSPSPNMSKKVLYFVDVTPAESGKFPPYKDIIYHDAYNPQTLNRDLNDTKKAYAEKFPGTLPGTLPDMPWEGVMWGTSYDSTSPRLLLEIKF
jgi:hypothetical protein